MTRFCALIGGFLLALACAAHAQVPAQDVAWGRQVLGVDHSQPMQVTALPGRPRALARIIHWHMNTLGAVDAHRCNFTTSCGRYCMEAVALHGFWAGLFMGLDRNMRCHRFQRGFYPWDQHHGRSIDDLRP